MGWGGDAWEGIIDGVRMEKAMGTCPFDMERTVDSAGSVVLGGATADVSVVGWEPKLLRLLLPLPPLPPVSRRPEDWLAARVWLEDRTSRSELCC